MTNLSLPDDRLDVLRRAVVLIHAGDMAGEDPARNVASHLCWDGATDLVSDLPDADPMEPGELRTLLEDTFTSLDLLNLNAWSIEDLFAVEGVPFTARGAEDWRIEQDEHLTSVLRDILVLQDRAVARAVQHYGFAGHYAARHLVAVS